MSPEEKGRVEALARIAYFALGALALSTETRGDSEKSLKVAELIDTVFDHCEALTILSGRG